MGQVTVTKVDAKIQVMQLDVMLQKFFELPGVYETIQEYVNDLKSNTGEGHALENFLQGSIWAEIAESFPNEEVYPIFCYHGDIQANNPLGSHIQQLGAIYCLFPFLPPQFRSSLENVFMLALYESIDKTTFGYSQILPPVLDEL